MSCKRISPDTRMALIFCFTALLTMGLVPVAVAGFFSETFDDGNAATRFTTSSINNPVADYAYDYSADGIPSAPNSTGGSTTGLRMAARTTVQDAGGAVSATRNGMALTGDFTMMFDMWMNYNGGAGGGTGSTEFALWGLNNNTSGVLSTQFTGGTADGYAFTATGEGGAGGDYRIYYTDPGDDGSQFPKFNAVWAAGGNTSDTDGDEPDNNFHSYYNDPITGIFPSPPFETAGSPGKQWVQVMVQQVGGAVSTFFNGNLVSTLTLADAADGDGRAYLSYADIFSGSFPGQPPGPGDELADAFVIFDNVKVIPEPSAIILLLFAALGFIGFGRRR